MSELVSVLQAAQQLRDADNILILTHQYPDGDTLGSGFALCAALRKLGKTTRVVCSDDIPEKYAFMQVGLEVLPPFTPDFVCAVDIADTRLLGQALSVYADKVDLCIDHHGSNTRYAKQLVLIPDYAATAMIICEVIRAMKAELDIGIASCIYTGIATDTGCFKYANTTSYTLRMAADMLDYGIPSELINRSMFDIKSRARVELERMALENMRFYLNDRMAVMIISNEMIEQSGANQDDMEGLAPLPRQIEGVWVGATLRENAEGAYKVSIRTGTHANAAAICGKLGGGGHIRAAGCVVEGPLESAIDVIVQAVRETFEE